MLSSTDDKYDMRYYDILDIDICNKNENSCYYQSNKLPQNNYTLAIYNPTKKDAYYRIEYAFQSLIYINQWIIQHDTCYGFITDNVEELNITVFGTVSYDETYNQTFFTIDVMDLYNPNSMNMPSNCTYLDTPCIFYQENIMNLKEEKYIVSICNTMETNGIYNISIQSYYKNDTSYSISSSMSYDVYDIIYLCVLFIAFIIIIFVFVVIFIIIYYNTSEIKIDDIHVKTQETNDIEIVIPNSK